MQNLGLNLRNLKLLITFKLVKLTYLLQNIQYELSIQHFFKYLINFIYLALKLIECRQIEVYELCWNWSNTPTFIRFNSNYNSLSIFLCFKRLYYLALTVLHYSIKWCRYTHQNLETYSIQLKIGTHQQTGVSELQGLRLG